MSTKRKRSKNTSSQQLEIYLNMMESDYIFQSNTINPTVDPNYISKKWEELTIKLIAVGSGPSLSTEEWKKRFLDWKYSTKSKFTKLKASRLQTGGGPQEDLKLTDIEECGLAVWGRVAVDGTPDVTSYEGIDLVPEDNNTENENQEDYEVLYIETVLTESPPASNSPFEPTPTTSLKQSKNKIRPRQRSKTKPLSVF